MLSHIISHSPTLPHHLPPPPNSSHHISPSHSHFCLTISSILRDTFRAKISITCLFKTFTFMIDTNNRLIDGRSGVPIPKRAPRPPPPAPMTEIFLRMITDFEVSRPHNINIMSVAERYKIQHRRAYDLFNLLTALKVCRSVERGRIAWNSISDAVKTVTSEYVKLETDSLFKSTRELFDLGPSPSLGTIATRFMALFIYLGVNMITLRQAVPLFHNPNCDIKSLERRLYLVLGMLEIMNLLSHSKRTGEYGIVADVEAIRSRAMRKKHAVAVRSAPASLEASLNRLDDAYVHSLLEARQAEYEKFYQ